MSYEEAKKRHEAQRARVEQALGINETQSVAPVNLGDVLKHLTPDTIRTIIIELTAAENNKWFHGEFKPSETTLLVRDFCATYMDAKWPGWNDPEVVKLPSRS